MLETYSDADGTGVCWICLGLVDTTIDGRLPEGPTLDHVIPRSKGGDPLDPNNARLAHKSCNSSKGNRPVMRKAVTSRAW